MKLKTLDHYKIDVNFLIEEEQQTLSLKVNCMTPRKIKEYLDVLKKKDAGFDDLVEYNCNVVTGWEGVTDEDGNEVEFSQDKLQDLQLDYFGLADAITVAIVNEGQKLREKNSGS